MNKEAENFLEFIQSDKSKEKYFTLEQVREFFLKDLTRYPKYGNFKQIFLFPVIDEINKNSKFIITFNEHIPRKPVAGLYFIIEKKYKRKPVKNRQTRTIIKANLQKIQKIVGHVELKTLIDNIKHNINRINNIADQYDFLEDTQTETEGYIVEYEDMNEEQNNNLQGYNIKRMKTHLSSIMQAIENRDFIKDDFLDVIDDIFEIIAKNEFLMNDIDEIVF